MKVVIDANAYLTFYNQTMPTLRKLLASIVEMKDKIFVTEQIVDEVLRNQVNCAFVTLASVRESLLISNASMPLHFTEQIDDSVKHWNKRRSNMKLEGETLIKEFDKFMAGVLESIQSSDDEVSTKLKLVFAGARKPTAKIIQRARARKELGNPPGKRDDPLGDQITWEQLLEGFDGAESIWLVTGDMDYWTGPKNDPRYLNAKLFKELHDKAGKKPDVRLFSKLNDFVEAYNKAAPLSTAPSEEEMKEIEDEQQAGMSVPYYAGSGIQSGGIEPLGRKANIFLPATGSWVQGHIQDLKNVTGPVSGLAYYVVPLDKSSWLDSRGGPSSDDERSSEK